MSAKFRYRKVFFLTSHTFKYSIEHIKLYFQLVAFIFYHKKVESSLIKTDPLKANLEQVFEISVLKSEMICRKILPPEQLLDCVIAAIMSL
jgi:hypothetical protein